MREEMRYLLHLWNDAEPEDMWRASLTELRSREVHNLTDLEALFAFLRERTFREVVEDASSDTEDPSPTE